MSRYFFHVVQGNQILFDDEGSELPNIEAARHEAVESAREIIINQIRAGDSIAGRAIWVRDERGHSVLTLSFREAFGWLISN